MQSRPRSEGGRDAKVASSDVQRSCNRLYDLVQRDDSGPRRPRTTPKPRVQRLLLGPSHEVLQDNNAIGAARSSACFMTHLPDSPPKPKISMSPRSSIVFSKSPRTGEILPSKEAGDVGVASSDLTASSAPTNFDVVASSGELLTDEIVDALDDAIIDEDTSSVESWQNDVTDEMNPLISAKMTPHEDAAEDGSSDRNSTGPALGDICGSPSPLGDPDRGEGPVTNIQVTMEDFADDDEQFKTRTADDKSEGDDEYAVECANRERILADASERLRLRSELESYLTSLRARKDDNGDAVVEFPNNYNQILALMTEKDIRAEDEDDKSIVVQQNWTRVLIQTGLSKQQAFGSLDDEESTSASENGLAAKIALKMAQIRQLDAVLEEKLGKNLYKAVPLRNKKPIRNQESDEDAAGPPRSFISQQAGADAKTKDSMAGNGLPGTSMDGEGASIISEKPLRTGTRRKTLHFIERNKEVVSNGMRANMTRAEEDRLSRLLEGDDSKSNEKPGDEAQSLPDLLTTPNEFAMDLTEKFAISQLLASKPDLSSQLILQELNEAMPLDDILEDEDATFIDPLRPGTIKQRLRLNRINQELRFLEEIPSISILCDDEYSSNDVEENGFDDTARDSDCRSERSLRSLTSAGGMSTTSSMCSSRSGIISRRQFSQFVAEQKAAFHSAPTASRDEIQRLLGSISRSSTPSSALTAPVS